MNHDHDEGHSTYKGEVKLPEPGFNNIYFHGGQDSQIYLTLTQDGRLVLGPGISQERATQEVAKMLVKEYQKLTGVEIL